MPRGIEEGDGDVLPIKASLLGKDGDPPSTFKLEGIEVGCFVVHTSHLFKEPSMVEEPFCEGGFAGIDVSEDSEYQLFHSYCSYLMTMGSDCYLLLYQSQRIFSILTFIEFLGMI